MTNRGDEMSHISFEKLTDYIDGRLDEVTSMQVEEHLSGNCKSCVSDLSWLEGTFSLMRTDEWVAPSASLNIKLISAFKNKFKPADAQPSLLDKVIALFTLRPQLAWGAAAALVLIVFFVAFSIGGRTVYQDATATAAVGTVMVRSAGGDVWQAVEEGSTFSAGDTIRTEDNSTVVLTYGDGSKTIVEANSEIHIVEMSAARNGRNQVTILAQSIGRTQHHVNELLGDDSHFEVRTPSALVTVVGTMFTVEVDQQGNTAVWVDEGIVAVSGGGQTVQLVAGESTFVQFGDVPATATALPSPTETPNGEGEQALATPAGLPDTPTPDPYESYPSSTNSPTPSPTPTVTVSAEPSETNTPSPTPTASATSTPADTAVPPTATLAPPTATLAPPTPVPPTPVPPTSTPVPPTSTPVPPTSTPVPPTATPVPPTATNTPDNSTPYPPSPGNDNSGDTNPPSDDKDKDPYP
ncbi:MAG: hypothetical protein BMS9Abin02_1415 [Anaerolineae bacterium]|nr:MAG: hypothetical protein BMS9Abin02_1415 [Anaerolineae bacterium]